MLIASMSPEGLVLVIVTVFGATGLGGLVINVITLIVGYKERTLAALREEAKLERDKVTAKKVEAVAVKTEEVAVALGESNAAVGQKLDGLAKVGEATHILVNNKMAIQLRMVAVMARRLAEKPDAVAAPISGP